MRGNRKNFAALGLASSIVVGVNRDARAVTNLQNTGFESGFSSWSTYVNGTTPAPDWRDQNSDAHTGSHSAVIDVDATAGTFPTFNGIYQTVTGATAGEAFYASAYITSANLASTPDSNSFIQVQFQNSSGTVLAQYTSPTVSTAGGYALETVTNAGNSVLVAPANTTQVQIQGVTKQLAAETGSRTEYWVYDDFNLSLVNPIISLTNTAPTNYGAQLTNGTGNGQATFNPSQNYLATTGSNGSYTLAQATGIKSSTGGNGSSTNYVEAKTFSPANDTEVYAFDVQQSGGAQATSGQLSQLATDINSNTAYGLNSVVASTSLSNNGFPSNYNLFLTFTSPPGTNGDNFLGFDLTQDPSTVSGVALSTLDVADVATATPEPNLVFISGLGTLLYMTMRRRRRIA